MVKGRADKWKTKSWYTVNAPEMFEGKEIAQVLANEEKNLMNRIVKVGLDELTGDLSHSYTQLIFRIVGVQGKSAKTKLIGHELAKGYLKTLVRRRRSAIDEIIDINTRDGVGVRMKINVYTARKVSEEIRRILRNEVEREAREKATNMDFQTLEQEVVFKKFAARIYNKIKKITPVKRVEVRKTEVNEAFAK